MTIRDGGDKLRVQISSGFFYKLHSVVKKRANCETIWSFDLDIHTIRYTDLFKETSEESQKIQPKIHWIQNE